MKLLDIQVSDDILQIVNEEVTRIKAAGANRTERDALILEKMTKIYSLIQANVRENVKAGMFGSMSDEDLNNAQSLESAIDGTESDDELTE